VLGFHFSIFFHTPQEMIRNGEPKKTVFFVTGWAPPAASTWTSGRGRCWVAWYGITFSNNCYGDPPAIPLKKMGDSLYPAKYSPENSKLESLKITEFWNPENHLKPNLHDLGFQLWWQLKYFLFSSRNLGKMNPFWRAYFSKGVGSTTNSSRYSQKRSSARFHGLYQPGWHLLLREPNEAWPARRALFHRKDTKSWVVKFQVFGLTRTNNSC